MDIFEKFYGVLVKYTKIIIKTVSFSLFKAHIFLLSEEIKEKHTWRKGDWELGLYVHNIHFIEIQMDTKEEDLLTKPSVRKKKKGEKGYW